MERRVVDADPTVIEPPTENGVPLIEPRLPVRRLVPIDVDATTCPVAFTPSKLFESEVMPKFVVVAFPNVVLPVNAFTPLKVLLLASNVEDAAVMVALPPRATLEPLIVTAEFCNWLLPIVLVATTWPAAFTPRRVLERPEKNVVPSVARLVEDWLMLMRLENVVDAEKRLLPENVLLLERSVELAELIETDPPSATGLPLIVIDEFWSWLLPIVEVATTWPDELTLSSVLERLFKFKLAPIASEL